LRFKRKKGGDSGVEGLPIRGGVGAERGAEEGFFIRYKKKRKEGKEERLHLLICRRGREKKTSLEEEGG